MRSQRSVDRQLDSSETSLDARFCDERSALRLPVYVRICHPAVYSNGNQASWSDVARATGRRPHRLMQWHALVGSADWLNMAGSLWEGENPTRGNLDPKELAVLCDLLARHTGTAHDCYFCLWEGYGGLERYGWLESSMGRHVFSPEELQASRLHLPYRDYLLLGGPLPGALCTGHWVSPKSFWPQSPNLFWPADRTWCVASEIDFDSTLVGGSVALIERILHDALLDSWRIEHDDLLTANADIVNLTMSADL